MTDDNNNQQENEDNPILYAFNIFDKDQDGFITVPELKSMMRSIGQSQNDSELHDMINEVDFDGYGKINFEQFQGLMDRKLREDDIEEELIETFKFFDKDGNGLIGPEELQNCFKALGENISQEEAKGMVQEADLDADGYVNFEEFKKMINGE